LLEKEILLEIFEKVGYVERRWSCGNSKSIRKGDREFTIL